MMRRLLILFVHVLLLAAQTIDRHSVVSRYNPTRNASSLTTPMQVGNGNFAFGADVTGMQTFQPFAIMSSWGWKNDSLPDGKTLQDIENYQGVSWLNHGRLVQYDFGGGNPIEQWLISNPNRVNLGRIGLEFRDEDGEPADITENLLGDTRQGLDLWTGILTSTFTFDGLPVTVKTMSAQSSDVVSFTITSPLLETGRLGVFLDFPWNDGTAKFSAPFVGIWNATSKHTTTLNTNPTGDIQAEITHELGSSVFVTSLVGDDFLIVRNSDSLHRYIMQPRKNSSTFAFSAGFALDSPQTVPHTSEVLEESSGSWKDFWTQTGFVDVYTDSTDARADELQRRIILSRYLMRVNEAGDTPPQESGLVNNGWYGKFHMEMYFWHSAQWALWNNWGLLRRSSDVYSRWLSSSMVRAQVQQGWTSGARWPKMTDPSGRSAPGQINNLLLWQQPHPFIFAQYEYRAFPSEVTLRKWEDVVRETANWMAAFAWLNETTSLYDIGPPMYPVSEDTSPNVTRNAAFELAYWRLGLGYAINWMKDLGADIPENWTAVKDNLAKLPVDNGTYSVYEGLESTFWTDPEYTNDHPALVGLHGWLPPTDDLDLDIAKLTAEKVWTNWNISNCWGWDFPMLAMSAARNGDTEKAIEWLLDPLLIFDDVGMPVGGVRVPTPYFPGSGSLLYAVAMMAAGWDGSERDAPGFPENGWKIRVEGVNKAL
ncbi:hypothetical protein Moror_14900 [Moniliophthora roreri MCA 2997]|uniref:Six-hairpin glycosidase-like protein n=1 Tax=Moniliophthora roreri (strain MCA 2997) TaxID=1381753 RepID=V2XZS7_MONRO|nr:hypothetical protein Moror_14900 [Moniliophthora roreri MCA 2997]